nr:unnamed protein product [Digitaria exilis]
MPWKWNDERNKGSGSSIQSGNAMHACHFQRARHRRRRSNPIPPLHLPPHLPADVCSASCYSRKQPEPAFPH